MKVGIIGGAMKPVTRGHWGLIKRASKENDRVRLFVSTADRSDENFTIKGDDMREVWEKYLTLHLPPNVSIEFVKNPIKSVYEALGKANEEHSIDEFTVYSDPVDITSRFPVEKQKKYFDELFDHGQIKFIPVERVGDMDVSGSKMRLLLKQGMKDEFKALLPEGVDGEGIWKTLVIKTFIRQL